jgi:hypothetical protein
MPCLLSPAFGPEFCEPRSFYSIAYLVCFRKLSGQSFANHAHFIVLHALFAFASFRARVLRTTLILKYYMPCLLSPAFGPEFCEPRPFYSITCLVCFRQLSGQSFANHAHFIVLHALFAFASFRARVLRTTLIL